jgi:hypothetical protein
MLVVQQQQQPCNHLLEVRQDGVEYVEGGYLSSTLASLQGALAIYEAKPPAPGGLVELDAASTLCGRLPCAAKTCCVRRFGAAPSTHRC